MELLLAVLMWIGVLSQEQLPYTSAAEANELFSAHGSQIESDFPEEYAIIITDENEVN